MKLIKIVLLTLLVILIVPSLACATVILDDSFNTTNNVDLNKTTARVDTSSGWVTLPQVSKPNAIAMRQFGYEYAVATANGIKMFTYDDATGTMVENTALSIPSITDALGIAVRQDVPNIWTLKDSELALYKFNGTSMSTNPNLKVSGLTDVVSVSSWSIKDKAVVLSRSGSGTGVIKVFDASFGTVVPGLSFDTGKVNPIAVSVVSGSPNLVVATKDAYYYYAYDDATGGYVEDPRRTVLGLSGVISVSSIDSGSAVLAQSEVQYYLNNAAGTPQQAMALSAGPVSGVAISVKPESYDYAIVTDSGDVQYYMYNDAVGSATRVNSLEVTGLALARGYLHPREYYSKVISAARNYDEVKLTVNDDIPVNTTINYFISSDGGLTWNAVTPGDWVSITPGRQFGIKAVLDTTDIKTAPKILQVTLEATALNIRDLKVLAIAFNDPTQTLPTSVFPVKVKSGAEILLEVTTEGFAESVYADFSTGAHVVFTAIGDINNETNIWRGLYTVPVNAVEGAPITATITAERNTKQKHLTVNPFIVVNGKVSSVIDLKMTM